MFVGGLSATTTAADVKTYFEHFGSVSDDHSRCGCMVVDTSTAGPFHLVQKGGVEAGFTCPESPSLYQM